MSEKFWHLKNCPLFEQLSDSSIRELESQARVRTVPRGGPIYLPADAANGVILLTRGRVKICHITPDGKQSILALINPGELFGELALFDAQQRDDYAEAVEKSEVVLIPADVMQRVMETQPTLTLGVTKLIGIRRRRIERRLKNLLFRSNRERLIHLLLELAEEYGKPSTSGVELGLKLSHQELANIIGSTRETVTVLLGDLQQEKRLVIARRRITLLDLEGLAQQVQEPPPKISQTENSTPANQTKWLPDQAT